MMERSSISYNAETIKATVSIGATVAQPEDSVDSLVRRADKLMYESKLSGRNRVTLN